MKSLNLEQRKKLLEKLKDPNEKLGFFCEEDKTYYKLGWNNLMRDHDYIIFWYLVINFRSFTKYIYAYTAFMTLNNDKNIDITLMNDK